MSEADDLSARINEARNESQRAKDTLSEAQEISNAIRDAKRRLHDPKTGRFIPDPNNPRSKYTWTDSDRRAAWRRLVEDPNSPLLPEQRQEIIDRGYRGPQFRNPITGELETTELSHEPVPLREGGTEVVPRDPREHARVDPHRYKPDNFTEAQRNAIRDAFWDRDGYREYDPRTWGTSPTAPPTNTFTESPTAPIVDTAAETPSGGVLRGANKFLGPAGHLLDAYSLYEAYDADGGFGENFRETASGIAGGAAGGWGGAAAGAALGTAIFPGVGTVVGGIAGGIAGGIGGEKIGEFLGGLF